MLRARRRSPSAAALAVLAGRPTERAGAAYRVFRLSFRLLAGALFRVRLSGTAHLPRTDHGSPAGGWICAALPHRTWVEPMLLIALLPAEPRLALLVDGPTVSRAWWRRLLVRRVGGVLPIPRGAATAAGAFSRHVAAAADWLAAGAVFGLFPELGAASRPPAVRRVAPSVAYLALRTGRPIVPIVFGGTDDLFLGRRIDVRVLEPLWPSPHPPPPGSAREREAARQLLTELLARVEPAATAAHRAALPRRGTRRRWRWLHGPFPRAG